MDRIKLLLLSLVLGGGVFVLDRWTKNIFFGRIITPVLGTIIETTSHHNFGLIANLPVPHFIIVALTSLIAVVVCAAFYVSIARLETRRALALILILSGALGNLYDRVTLSFVFDWILLFRWSIINVADIAIGLGILLYLMSMWRQSFVATEKVQQ